MHVVYTGVEQQVIIPRTEVEFPEELAFPTPSDGTDTTAAAPPAKRGKKPSAKMQPPVMRPVVQTSAGLFDDNDDDGDISDRDINQRDLEGVVIPPTSDERSNDSDLLVIDRAPPPPPPPPPPVVTLTEPAPIPTTTTTTTKSSVQPPTTAARLHRSVVTRTFCTDDGQWVTEDVTVWVDGNGNEVDAPNVGDANLTLAPTTDAFALLGKISANNKTPEKRHARGETTTNDDSASPKKKSKTENDSGIQSSKASKTIMKPLSKVKTSPKNQPSIASFFQKK
eukprot:PhM_4_TR9561/c3_g1_i1/m.38080